MSARIYHGRVSHARAEAPHAMILRPLPDGTTLVFDTVGDALGHPTAQVMQPASHSRQVRHD